MSSPNTAGPQTRTVFGRGSWSEAAASPTSSARRPSAARCCSSAAVVALVWANSPWRGLLRSRCATTTIGPEALHLDLTLGTWAADGLLAIFFFVVGLELKREFVAGDLRDPRRAALPIARRRRRHGRAGALSTSRSTSAPATARCRAGPSRPRPTSPSPSPSWP